MENKNKGQRIDYGIIVTMLLFAAVSLIAIYTALNTDPAYGRSLVIRQGAFYIIGAVAVAVIMRIDRELMIKLTPYLYVFGLFILLLVLIPGIGVEVNGARSWIKLPVVGQFQPAELMKICLVLMQGKVIIEHNKAAKIRTVRTDWVLLFKISLTSFIPFVLILLENDLGTGLVIMAITLGMFIISGITWRILLPLILGVFSLGAAMIYTVMVKPEWLALIGFKQYQFGRITSWLDPYSSADSDGYQLILAMQAIGSGEITGYEGTNGMASIPEGHTDMIFAMINHHWGFIAGSIVIALFFILVYQIIGTALDLKDEFYAVICTGVVMTIMFHVLENAGMTIGLLPITGIPLPFISYGGTSLVVNLLGIGVIMSMRFNSPDSMFSKEEKETDIALYDVKKRK
ncbi:FtsW/RodA/SpoVE family cell cycle protein [Brochothrix campestris]|uniref:FtsW/RodA/SpoVE family cell division protein n=1 Tax=Brochothrix campestris FSL F6-1037 TaxID=1265861 RepID=W7CZ36_9LIST|nr:FtsW/RodA/SpoVE family cell cycle protein [Brochothrix campestris]EUJ42030.1 FtsW/RodA/SpoVE family cell division protein [Brochothrix campestris FSL F6-1037]